MSIQTHRHKFLRLAKAVLTTDYLQRTLGASQNRHFCREWKWDTKREGNNKKRVERGRTGWEVEILTKRKDKENNVKKINLI